MSSTSIMIRIEGAIPTKVNCPNCSVDIDVPVQTDERPMYKITLTCTCGQQINLMCRK